MPKECRHGCYSKHSGYIAARLNVGCAGLSLAVAKMAGMMPSAARGTIGVKGHLLGSISRKYRREANLLWVAIKALVKTQNVT